MAMNPSISVSVLALVLFFAVASARVPLDPTENGIRTLHGSTAFLGSEFKPTSTLFLPSHPAPVVVDHISEPIIAVQTKPLEAQTAPLRRMGPISRLPLRPMVRPREQLPSGNDIVSWRFQSVGGRRFWIARINEVRPHHHHLHRFFHHPAAITSRITSATRRWEEVGSSRGTASFLTTFRK